MGSQGLSLGVALRRRGVPVVLHEAGSYPRHRVCGEFISGLSDAVVERLGIEKVFEGALAHQMTSWFVKDRKVLEAALPEPARGISRYPLGCCLEGIVARGRWRSRREIEDQSRG